MCTCTVCDIVYISDVLHAIQILNRWKVENGKYSEEACDCW